MTAQDQIFRTLDPVRVVETLGRLRMRIRERFEGTGLENVCAELIAIAQETGTRSLAIARPDTRLRAAVGAIVVSGIALFAATLIQVAGRAEASNDLFGILQGIDAAFNLLLVVGAALLFMVTLEERLKRRRALRALHEIRSIIHVIDMHQLTKDPWTEVSISQPTPSSPKRDMSAVELIHYLDYCSEMLSLASKVAVLYSQSFPDPVVTETVNDMERTAAGLAQKIWQKINIVHRSLEGRLLAGEPLPQGGSALRSDAPPVL